MEPEKPKKGRPRLCFVGPMLGRNPGYVTTQGEKLTDLFARAGYPVASVSTLTNRYLRLADIISTLIRHGRNRDILMLQVYGGPSFVVEDIASWLGRRSGQRIIIILRGGALPEFMARFPRWTRRVLSRADALVAPSSFLARAVARFGFRAEVIPNVIDISAYECRHRQTISPRILWMRTFEDIYNPMMAVRTLARLRSSVPEATLVMGGQDTGLETEVRRLAKELGLNGAVRFPGFLDMRKKVLEGGSADIFINTNSVDNMPVSVVEACAMGLPVVATAAGGVPDLLTDGETGLLVPDNDDEAMVAAIRRLLDDPALAGRLSANGRRLAENCSWEKVRPRWEKIFAEVMTAPLTQKRSEVL